MLSLSHTHMMSSYNKPALDGCEGLCYVKVRIRMSAVYKFCEMTTFS